MKCEEFKRRAMQFGNQMVDSYFPVNDNVLNKVANNMCKYVLKSKINTIDKYLVMFADSEGEIDVRDFVEYMQTNMIGDGLKINMHDYMPLMPDRTLTVHREDLNCLLG